MVTSLLGAQWAPAAEMLRPLAFLYFTNLVTTPWSAAVDSAQRQDVFLLRESVRLVLVGGAAVFVAVTEPSAQFAVEILCAVGAVSYIWYYFVCSWALDHPRNLEAVDEPHPGGGER